MLGDKIGEMQGKVTARRVLPGDDYRYLKMEITIEESGTLFGANATNEATYTAFERVPGQIYGQGQGLLATTDGETAMWNGHGVAHMTGPGAGMSFRYSIAVQAGSGGKLARLNSVLVVGEHEVDEQGNTRTNMFEWK